MKITRIIHWLQQPCPDDPLEMPRWQLWGFALVLVIVMAAVLGAVP